jgi:ABC transport system ATP-binding/permease protein
MAATEDAPPFIAVAASPVIIGRSGEATLRLLHPTISRRHATITRRDKGFALEDHDSRFGTVVNGARVRKATLRTGDRVQFGSSAVYRVESGGLQLDVAAEGISLAAQNLAIYLPRTLNLGSILHGLLPLDRSKVPTGLVRPESHPLIKNISFRVQSNSFVGILGPSGAGKSTVLNCLASYLIPGKGRLLFDGQRDIRDELDTYRTMLGHVSQDDVVFGSLTIRENLAYAARLRLGDRIQVVDIEETISQVLDRVGLLEHATKPVAVLSGGQRKRLSVAIELLGRPRLLLLDEPTSGLDPASEAHLMEQLRHLARQGTTIVCTTHLMENVLLFDEVIVLGLLDHTGRIAYTGPPDDLLQRFGHRGFADLYEALESGRFEPFEPAGDEPTALTGDPMLHEVRQEKPGSDTSVPRPPRRLGVGQLATRSGADTSWRQFPIVVGRALRLVRRDRGLVLAIFAQPLILGLLVCLTQYDVDKLLPVLFFAVVIAIWLGLNNSARDLVRERRHYLRDRLAGLHPGAYLGAKTVVHAAIGTVQLLILIVVLRLGCGWVLQFEAVAEELHKTSAIWLFLVTMASYMGGVGLGLFVSTVVRTEEAAVATLPLLIMPQLLMSAVASGVQIMRYDEQRPFRPLVVALHEARSLPGPAALVDILSMACLSRPAVLVIESPHVPGYGGWTWLGDLCHLLILLMLIWTMVCLAFQRAEQRWLRLIGI